MVTISHTALLHERDLYVHICLHRRLHTNEYRLIRATDVGAT